MKIGITGGIGSGKSFLCKLLEKKGFEIYDCDCAAKRLMRESATLREQLTQLIGPDTYIQTSTSQGTSWQLNKAAVAKYLLASEANASAVDAIVHPAVFRDFEKSGLSWMESAIMFESGINRLVDKVIAVTAPEDIRVQRIVRRDGITPEKAREWIARQWSQDKVRQLADYEIVNDGQHPLEPQLDKVMRHIRMD